MARSTTVSRRLVVSGAAALAGFGLLGGLSGTAAADYAQARHIAQQRLLPAASLQPKAYPNAAVGVIGHGWGHGYGMGQWGALGYALGGESYTWILAHYYGGTTFGTVPDIPLRVVITGNDGKDTIITSESPFHVDSFPVPAGEGVLIRLQPSGTFAVYSGSSCGGPWNLSSPLETAVAPVVAPGPVSGTGGSGSGGSGTGVSTTTTTTSGSATGTTPTTSSTTSTSTTVSTASSTTTTLPGGGGDLPANQLLQLCRTTTNEYLRGEIETASYQGSQRTLNVVRVEDYLQGVVPSESPSYWGKLGSPGPQGEPEGFQELEAQAVAARSYALSDLGRYGFADICDSTECQVYGGASAESTLGNLAVADTAGQVVDINGSPAYAEFSSSTGGFTSGGSFTAVPDAGDSVCVPSACNPRHTWTASIPVSQIESAFPGIGTLDSIAVTQRDGNGDFGGRALQVTLTGDSGSAALTGNEFEADFGLDSNFFAFTGTPSGGDSGYWLVDSQGKVFAYGSSAFDGEVPAGAASGAVVGLVASPGGGGYWVTDQGGNVDTYGSAEYFGSTDQLTANEPPGGHNSVTPAHPIVGIAATADGKGYWLVASDGGVFTFGDAGFFGSASQLNPATPPGGTNGITLNKPVVGIAATADGKGYWLVASDGGVFTFGDAGFYGSLPGEAVYSTATGIAPSADGRGYDVVTANGEVHAFGDAPLLGDLSTPDPGYTSGTIVGMTMKAGG